MITEALVDRMLCHLSPDNQYFFLYEMDVNPLKGFGPGYSFNFPTFYIECVSPQSEICTAEKFRYMSAQGLYKKLRKFIRSSMYYLA